MNYETKEKDSLLKILRKRRDRLEKIKNLPTKPADEVAKKEYYRKKANADSYIKEVDILRRDFIVSDGIPFLLVSQTMLDNLIDEADFFELLYEGNWTTVAEINNNPYDDHSVAEERLCLVYLKPLQNL